MSFSSFSQGNFSYAGEDAWKHTSSDQYGTYPAPPAPVKHKTGNNVYRGGHGAAFGYFGKVSHNYDDTRDYSVDNRSSLQPHSSAYTGYYSAVSTREGTSPHTFHQSLHNAANIANTHSKTGYGNAGGTLYAASQTGNNGGGEGNVPRENGTKTKRHSERTKKFSRKRHENGLTPSTHSNCPIWSFSDAVRHRQGIAIKGSTSSWDTHPQPIAPASTAPVTSANRSTTLPITTLAETRAAVANAFLNATALATISRGLEVSPSELSTAATLENYYMQILAENRGLDVADVASTSSTSPRAIEATGEPSSDDSFFFEDPPLHGSHECSSL